MSSGGGASAGLEGQNLVWLTCAACASITVSMCGFTRLFMTDTRYIYFAVDSVMW